MLRPVFFAGILFAGLSSAIPLALGQEHCKPLLAVSMPTVLPCAANIAGGFLSEELSPPKAIEQARQVLWDHFARGAPSFLNLRLASREGAETRIVYVLEKPANSESLVIRWAMQRQVIDVRRQTAKWGPVENFRATTVTRNETTGVLTFRNGFELTGEL